MEHVPGRLYPADPLTRCEPFETVPPGSLPQPMEDVASSAAAAAAAVTERPESAGSAKTTGPARYTPAYPRAFTPLAGARLHLVTGEITVQPNPSQPSRQFLAPDFVAALRENEHRSLFRTHFQRRGSDSGRHGRQEGPTGDSTHGSTRRVPDPV